MIKYYVYKITCLCDEWNGKFYIGSHTSYKEKDFNSYTGSGRKINEYFNKYPKIEGETYTREILCYGKNGCDVKDKEQIYLQKYKDDENILNLKFFTDYGNSSRYNKEKYTREKVKDNFSNELRKTTSDAIKLWHQKRKTSIP